MPTEYHIGTRIRSFREERDIDLENLAQTTNLSVEFLEKLENGEIYPSIGPLQKVARALGVRLGTFLDDQYTRDPIIGHIGGAEADQALHTGRMPRPSYVYHSLGKGKSDRNMEPFYIEIFPDPSVERKTSSHQGEEFIMVLKGELLVIYGRESHVLKAGDTIYYNSIVPHFVGAAGDEPVEIMAVAYNP
ncbi:helix-turn-helix transcriptional regulator [Desulfovibrio sp. PG-178-WT-4]|uniref:Helix-turn-helix transcriptional regulator n=1 Tax=Desulfovibrio porci TaxID=2605782 RepID=A0A6L5XIB2_9BACT|nr:XRE family transcriptional regulator [Desulfovibrio porci]MSS26857.1 helix-turn-helix transcriptional regulator [Desulfovibrio porci]